MSEQTPEFSTKDAADLATFRVAGMPVINASGLPDTVVSGSAGLDEIATQWSNSLNALRAAPKQAGGMFARHAYTPPENVYDIRAAARHAFENDDVVRACIDMMVHTMFEDVQAEAEDPLSADLFNQIFSKINMDGYLRQVATEFLICSEAVSAKQMAFVDLQARGKTTNGNKKKTKRTVWAPLGLGLIDQQHVVPLDPTPVGPDRLAWMALPETMERFRLLRAGLIDDPAMRQFYLSRVTELPIYEQMRLSALNVDYFNLIELNPALVFRHTEKLGYQRHAVPRLKSVLSLLDLKQHKMLADRANLIGSAQYFVLITKGSDKQPATQAELNNLNDNMKVLAKLPVMVADHRLDIKIVAPPQDFVLDPLVYESLDRQIAAGVLGLIGSELPGGDTINTGVLSKNLESMRRMIARTIEKHVIEDVVDHPLNAGVFESTPSLVFSPNRIRLTSDAAVMQMLLNLRTNREISRETILAYLGISEQAEALRVMEEKERYDHIFESIVAYSGAQPDGTPGQPGAPAATAETAPGSHPDPKPASKETPAQSGARGGRPRGTGRGVRTNKVTEATASGNPSTKKA